MTAQKRRTTTDSGNDSPLRVGEEGMGKGYDPGDHLFLPLKLLQELPFESLFETESLRDAEGHGRDGDDGDQGVEGQGRCSQLALVFVESAQ